VTTLQFQTDAKALIDDLKAVCANAGLGNDGNEFKIITQIFLYKFLNDKFAYEAKHSGLSIREYDRDKIFKARVDVSIKNRSGR
jgi:type I restriction enzyme M protein